MLGFQVEYSVVALLNDACIFESRATVTVDVLRAYIKFSCFLYVRFFFCGMLGIG